MKAGNPFGAFRGTVTAVALFCAPVAAWAQETPSLTTSEEVRSEASEAIATYSAQERDEALVEVRQALDRIDAEIERREQALRENWADAFPSRTVILPDR